MKTLMMAVSFAFIALNCNAQRGERKAPPTTEEVFEQMDADQDGLLAESEVKGPLKKDFATIDANQDGFISPEELENAPKPEKKKRTRGRRED
ncbi:EF-hand domain-containing protein [Saprospira grandis]|uniref:EF-hand domain-containing protein n=1 Tax=Saprospira grandis (strain Lewin) TaxID=984262 RepID=H6KZZ2_SAPGL|nr:EF-hand domain-containing protein [Saprospira grandis]AFC25999.1 hypothetical protein SGRA_3271 [Saprospira grandis str. Lewin]